MAYTRAQLDALQAAIAQGALEVEYGDKRVKYRSLDEMMRIERRMLAALGTRNQNAGRRFAEFDKGL